LPQNFPTIDKFNKKTGTVTSIKSLDLNAKTYQNPKTLNRIVEKYVDILSKFSGATVKGTSVGAEDIKSRVLEIAIPNTGSAIQKSVMDDLIKYGKSFDVHVNFTLFK
jgi:hypothetical protein